MMSGDGNTKPPDINQLTDEDYPRLSINLDPLKGLMHVSFSQDRSFPEP